MRTAHFHIALLCAFLIWGTGSAHGDDPTRVWRVIESPHFAISYTLPHTELAQSALRAAERAHDFLAPTLGHAPDNKTNLILTDETDSANGFAFVDPRNVIRLFPARPEGDNALADHDDWLFQLIAHEYTHIIHIDTVRGLASIYNRFFGKTWVPNQSNPRWITEGIAVYEESLMSSSGRARNSFFEMLLRVAELSGTPYLLDRLSHSPRKWPHGNAAYLYGGVFFKYFADRFGQKALREYSHRYSAQLMPWDFGRAMRKATSVNLDQVHQDWRHFLSMKFNLASQSEENLGLRQGRRLTFHGENTRNPRYTARGKICYLRSDGYSDSAILCQRGNGWKTVDEPDGMNGFDSSTTTGTIVISQIHPYRTIYPFHDLVSLDAKSGKKRRLTRRERAREPDLSPDGKRVLYVKSEDAESKLAIRELSATATSIELELPGKAFFAPSWSPQGRFIAFSAQRNRQRDVFVYDLEAKSLTQITNDRALDSHPEFSPDGKWLYFTSNRNGVHNIYAFERDTKKLYQVTRLLGGAFDFTIHPRRNKLIYQGYHAKGFDLYELELNPGQWQIAAPFIDDRPVKQSNHWGGKLSAPRPYRALDTLAPQSWSGEFSQDSFGNRAISLQLAGADLVGWHRYNLGLFAGSTRANLSVSASYSYNRLWPSFRISTGRNIRRPGGLLVDGISTRYNEESFSLSLATSLPLFRSAGASFDLSFSWDMDYLRYLDEPPPPDPSAEVTLLPESGLIQGPGLSFNFSNIERYTYGTGPQKGRTISFFSRANTPLLGSEYRSIFFGYRHEEYMQVPFTKSQSMLLRQAGGWVDSNRRGTSPYSLAGVPQQSILNSIRLGGRAPSTGLLRGFQSGTFKGNQYHLINLEYRWLIYDIDQGYTTLPLFVRRLHAAVHSDLGWVFGDNRSEESFGSSIGASLRLDTTWGFTNRGTLELGYARGMGPLGQNDVWVLLTSGI